MDDKLLFRFWAKVDKTPECWNWNASLAHHGYGQFMWNYRPWKAHRVSWLIHFDSIPEGKMVLHTCDNRKCVNPDHLYIGTAADNTRDMMAKNRCSRTHVKRGEDNPCSKLTLKQVEYIRANYVPRKKPTLTDLAKMFSVSITVIWKSATYRTWPIS